MTNKSQSVVTKANQMRKKIADQTVNGHHAVVVALKDIFESTDNVRNAPRTPNLSKEHAYALPVQYSI